MIETRKATIEDAGALAELSTQLGYPATVKESKTRLNQVLGSVEDEVIVACLPDGTVVGWVHVFRALRVESDPFAELGGFVVSQDHRRAGIGRQLLAVAEAWAVRQGTRTMRVRSRTSRDDARAFYQHMGFSETKQQRVFDKELKTNP